MRFKFLLILTLIFLNSCEEDSTITFTESNITSSSNKIVEVNIPIAIGDELVINNINSIIANHIIYSLHLGDRNKISASSIEESIDGFNNEYKSFKADFPDNPQLWDAQIDGEVMYKSKDVISIAITTYTNTGGAHGNLNITFLNFNPLNGRLFTYSDIVNDVNTFKNLAESHFKKVIKGKENQYFDNKEFILPANIGFNYNGIVLLYNVYEIASYSTGVTEVTIPYNELKSLLNIQ